MLNLWSQNRELSIVQYIKKINLKAMNMHTYVILSRRRPIGRISTVIRCSTGSVCTCAITCITSYTDGIRRAVSTDRSTCVVTSCTAIASYKHRTIPCGYTISRIYTLIIILMAIFQVYHSQPMVPQRSPEKSLAIAEVEVVLLQARIT